MIDPEVLERQRTGEVRTKRSAYCAEGCGRRVQAGKPPVCSSCRSGRPTVLPRVDSLPTDYLLTCVEELKRRRAMLEHALKGEDR